MLATVTVRRGPPHRRAQGEARMLSRRTHMGSLAKYEGRGEGG